MSFKAQNAILRTSSVIGAIRKKPITIFHSRSSIYFKLRVILSPFSNPFFRISITVAGRGRKAARNATPRRAAPSAAALFARSGKTPARRAVSARPPSPRARSLARSPAAAYCLAKNCLETTSSQIISTSMPASVKRLTTRTFFSEAFWAVCSVTHLSSPSRTTVVLTTRPSAVVSSTGLPKLKTSSMLFSLVEVTIFQVPGLT